MAAVRSRDTKPELLIRRELHRLGFRFRLSPRTLPGRPDIVLPRFRAAIFVHGCFWHGHGCHLFKLPRTRPEFWEEKIAANRRRDQKAVVGLRDEGWRVAVIWECALRGPHRLTKNGLFDRLPAWIRSETLCFELHGTGPGLRLLSDCVGTP